MSSAPTIVAVGEILVEFVSHQLNCGLEKTGEFTGPYPSGAPAIFLDQAARMGAKTEMVGGVGDDGFGRIVLQRLKDDGVGTGGIAISLAETTGVAFVSYYENGERDFIFHLSNTAADNFELPEKIENLSNVSLYVSTSSLGNPRLRAHILNLVSKTSAAGGQITCDLNVRPELMRDSSYRAALQTVITNSYCIMPSTSDMDFLFPGLSEEAAIDELLNSNTDIVVLKRGSGGATVVGDHQRYDFPGHAVTEIDPTGAGDCFCGTFVALLAQNFSLKEAGEHANAAGAISVTRRGPMEGNSDLAEIGNFLKQLQLRELSA